MTPLFWWTPVFQLPFGGDVAQRIEPETDWFLGNVDPALGDPDVERTVVREVAPYGKQLGMLTEALLALAEKVEANELPTVQRVRDTAAEVNAVKDRVGDDRRRRARVALDALAEDDPVALAALLREYSSRVAPVVAPPGEPAAPRVEVSSTPAAEAAE